MCGFVGAVGFRGCDDFASAVERATAMQAHRGPDDDGVWTSATSDGRRVGLGSRRLAILDLSPAGHMPMATPDGRYRIAYNGEIYNYPDLRERLEARGHSFRSGCDTEAVLYAYAEWGAGCVERLRGMFAFAIWDAADETLFAARDQFGIKPLYYWRGEAGLVLASEAKSIFAFPGIPRAICAEALHQYLSFLWVPDPLTMFDGVEKLPAGHRAIWRDGNWRVERYWDLEYPVAGAVPERPVPELATELRERFADVVHSQLISDVPLGAFLSAGLDSSSIVAAMVHRAAKKPIRTFTIAFPEAYRRGEVTLDDTDVAARAARAFGAEHTEILVEPDVVDLLPKLVWHMDEPTADPAIITAYLVNRAARKDVTVLLSGVGGDELFGGYRKYRAHALAQRYQRIPAALRDGVIEPVISKLPSFRGTPIKGYVRLAKKMARSGSLPPEERFIADSIYLAEHEKAELYTADWAACTAVFDPMVRHRAYFGRVRHADFTDQMLYLDTKAFMVSLNLTYNDKMSMASSVEVRVPFLDVELAEWTARNIPAGLKVRGAVTKFILREAMKDWLPAEILRQKKAGFGAPVDYWLAKDLRGVVDDLLSAGRVRERGLFEPSAVQRMVREQRNGRRDWSMQIWQLLTLELWMRTFIDRDGTRPL